MGASKLLYLASEFTKFNFSCHWSLKASYVHQVNLSWLNQRRFWILLNKLYIYIYITYILTLYNAALDMVIFLFKISYFINGNIMHINISIIDNIRNLNFRSYPPSCRTTLPCAAKHRKQLRLSFYCKFNDLIAIHWKRVSRKYDYSKWYVLQNNLFKGQWHITLYPYEMHHIS